MLNRNSNISTKKIKAPQGRKIENGVQVTAGTHGISMDHRKSEQYEEQIYMMEFKKPSKSTISKNKENIDTNLPTKRTLHKAQSTKSMSRIKKSTFQVKSKIGHKKVDSARSSLSKRSRSQTYIGLKKQQHPRKSFSPKTSRPTTHRQTKPLISQRELKTTRNKEVDRLKKKDISINSSKNNQKKKKKVIISEINPILNDSSIDIAKQLQNITKNFTKTKKSSSKKLLPTTKHQKKVIVSDISKPKYENKDSPEHNHLLTQKYKKEKVPSQPKSFSRHKSSKTKQHIAAIIIQRAFRKYKQIQHHHQINRIMLSIITIQRWWRNYLRVRNSSELPRLLAQSSLVTIQDFSNEMQAKKNLKLNIQLISDSKDESIKDRIKYLLQDSQSKSNKFMETKKFSFSPIKKVQKQQLPLRCYSSPKSENFVENLQNLQKFHKQKLVKSFNNQRQAIVKLWEQKLCSPRTQQGKLIELDERLNKQLLRFEVGIKEVLRGISLTKDDQNSQQLLKSPPKMLFPEIAFDHSYDSKNKNNTNNDIKEISEMQIQLSFNKDDKDTKATDFKFDSSMQAVKMYIDQLYEYLQSIPGWSKQFISLMNQYRGISILCIISGLQEQQQQQSSNSFKLPLYKQYRDSNTTIISNDKIQQFNKRYCEQRANESQLSVREIGIYEYFHIQAVVDSLNQQLHLQKPLNSLTSVEPKNIFSQPQPDTIEKTFIKSCQLVIECTTVLCGFIDDNNQLQQQYLTNIQQQRLKQMIISTVKSQLQQCNMNPQIIEVSTLIAEAVVIEMFEQMAIELYQIRY